LGVRVPGGRADGIGAQLAQAAAMSSDLAFSVGLLAGWLALVVWLVWPDPHCKCCSQRERAHAPRDRRV